MNNSAKLTDLSSKFDKLIDKIKQGENKMWWDTEDFEKVNRDEMLKYVNKTAKDMIFKVYKNNKTGKDYVVSSVVYDATNEREGNPVVVYFIKGPLTELKGIFCRDLGEFKEKFEYTGERVDFLGMGLE